MKFYSFHLQILSGDQFAVHSSSLFFYTCALHTCTWAIIAVAQNIHRNKECPQCIIMKSVKISIPHSLLYQHSTLCLLFPKLSTPWWGSMFATCLLTGIFILSRPTDQVQISRLTSCPQDKPCLKTENLIESVWEAPGGCCMSVLPLDNRKTATQSNNHYWTTHTCTTWGATQNWLSTRSLHSVFDFMYLYDFSCLMLYFWNL